MRQRVNGKDGASARRVEDALARWIGKMKAPRVPHAPIGVVKPRHDARDVLSDPIVIGDERLPVDT